MAIVYAHDKDGSFIAGDTASRMTCYAYPSSTHATQAKRNTPKVAAEMIAGEQPHHLSRPAYDRLNWERIERLTA